MSEYKNDSIRSMEERQKGRSIFAWKSIKANATLLLVFIFCGYVWWIQYENGKLLEHGWWLIPIFISGVRLSDFFEDEKKFKFFFQDPWIRYSLTIILCGLSWEFSKDTDFAQRHSADEVSLAISLPLLIAAYFARELVLIIVPSLLIIKLVLYLLMMLPVVDRVAVIALVVALASFYYWNKKDER